MNWKIKQHGCMDGEKHWDDLKLEIWMSNLFKALEFTASQWRHNECNGVSNHRRLNCLLSRLFRRRSMKNKSSASLAFVRDIHRWPVDSAYKGLVTRKMFPFDDAIMWKGIVAILMEFLPLASEMVILNTSSSISDKNSSVWRHFRSSVWHAWPESLHGRKLSSTK